MHGSITKQVNYHTIFTNTCPNSPIIFLAGLVLQLEAFL